MEKDKMSDLKEHKKYDRGFLHTPKGGALVFGSLGALASGVVISTSLNSLESLEHAVRTAALVIPITITAGAIAGYVDEKVLGLLIIISASLPIKNKLVISPSPLISDENIF